MFGQRQQAQLSVGGHQIFFRSGKTTVVSEIIQTDQVI
jgi:hypothetical protein